MLRSVAAGLVLTGLAGCSSALGPTTQEDVSRPGIGAGAPVGSSTATSGTPDLALGFTGRVEHVTVPAGATAAYVSVSGGAGPGDGTGVILTGTLDVAPGDGLDVAVGGRGSQEKTNQHPGEGGWSLPPYAGGRGGSGRGSQAYDGSGGGGASVVQVNGTTVVVAAGGGGEGGPASKEGADAGNPGGAGGMEAGETGQATSKGTAGRGGSNARPDQSTTGGSYSGKGIKGGGGGGGGGRFPGGGGKASFGTLSYGGGGGGGGTSLADALVSRTARTRSEGNPGQGAVNITWLYSPSSGSSWTFTKINAPTPQALEAQQPTDATSAPAVSTHAITYRADGSVVPRQSWTYVLEPGQRAGQLKNQDTGLCLEVNGNSGAVDQWPCDTTSANHQWRLLARKDGVTTIRTSLPAGDTPKAAGTYYLATSTAAGKTVDGTALTLLTDGLDARTTWSGALVR